jgi:hypothetical protein
VVALVASLPALPVIPAVVSPVIPAVVVVATRAIIIPTVVNRLRTSCSQHVSSYGARGVCARAVKAVRGGMAGTGEGAPAAIIPTFHARQRTTVVIAAAAVAVIPPPIAARPPAIVP